MNVGVLGSGMVGQALSAKIAATGNDVVMGTRDIDALQSRNEIATWLRDNPAVRVATFAAAAESAEIVFNATAGHASLAALEQAGAANLAGKIVVDVANALDFSGGMPPTLSVVNTDSLGEQIQRAFPAALVVKTLNTVNASVMVDPASVGAGEHDVFVCGNDAVAKKTVSTLLRTWFGWHSIIDLGDITAARAVEMYLPLWLRVMGATGTAAFNIKVVQ